LVCGPLGIVGDSDYLEYHSPFNNLIQGIINCQVVYRHILQLVFCLLLHGAEQRPLDHITPPDTHQQLAQHFVQVLAVVIQVTGQVSVQSFEHEVISECIVNYDVCKVVQAVV